MDVDKIALAGSLLAGLFGGGQQKPGVKPMTDTRTQSMARTSRAQRVRNGQAITGKSVKSTRDGRGSQGIIAKNNAIPDVEYKSGPKTKAASPKKKKNDKFHFGELNKQSFWGDGLKDGFNGTVGAGKATGGFLWDEAKNAHEGGKALMDLKYRMPGEGPAFEMFQDGQIFSKGDDWNDAINDLGQAADGAASGATFTGAGGLAKGLAAKLAFKGATKPVTKQVVATNPYGPVYQQGPSPATPWGYGGWAG